MTVGSCNSSDISDIVTVVILGIVVTIVGPMGRLGTGYLTCGPMRGLNKFTRGGGGRTEHDTQTS